jgi:hypothetical protein
MAIDPIGDPAHLLVEVAALLSAWLLITLIVQGGVARTAIPCGSR